MKSGSPSLRSMFLVYLCWLAFPFLLQIVLSQILFLNYYYSFQAIILEVVSDLITYSLIPLSITLAMTFGAALVAGYLVLSFRFFRKLFLIVGPIIGLVITGIAFYIGTQGREGFQASFVFLMMGLFIGYYWYVLSALLPIIWALKTPADSLGMFIKRTILPGLGLALIFGVIVSILSYPMTQEKRQRELKEKQYKSSLHYLTPMYLPKKVGKLTYERVRVRTDVYDSIGTVGFARTYACKGESLGYETFEIVEGPIKEQIETFEELYQEIKAYGERNYAYRTLEKVNLNNGIGIYRESQTIGTSHEINGQLVYEIGDTRIDLHISEACIEDVSKIKEELIKIANSLS